MLKERATAFTLIMELSHDTAYFGEEGTAESLAQSLPYPGELNENDEAVLLVDLTLLRYNPGLDNNGSLYLSDAHQDQIIDFVKTHHGHPYINQLARAEQWDATSPDVKEIIQDIVDASLLEDLINQISQLKEEC